MLLFVSLVRAVRYHTSWRPTSQKICSNPPISLLLLLLCANRQTPCAVTLRCHADGAYDRIPEYAAPAWHHLVKTAHRFSTWNQSKIHIIFNFTRGMSYPNVLFVAQLESLETKRSNLSRSFFSRYLQTNLLSSSSHSTSPRYLRYH